MNLFGDFETKSACSLKDCGPDVYSRHPTSDVLCLALAVDDDEPFIWTPEDGLPPAEVFEDFTAIGHNLGGFDWYIWNNICVPKYGFPPLSIEKCIDTMPMAYAMGLPGSLEQAAGAAGLDVSKDKAGRRTMIMLSTPRSKVPLTWWEKSEVPEKFEQLYSYSKQDIVVTRSLFKKLPQLSDHEKRIWCLDQKINQRGVGLDLEAAHKAITVAERETERYTKELQIITGGAVPTPNSNVNFTRWLNVMGVDADGVAKADITDLLKLEGLSAPIRRALEIRQEAGKSSVAKYEAMIHSTYGDNRARGLFTYHGATTGRWAGRRVQLQNLPRPQRPFEEIETVIAFIKSQEAPEGCISAIYGSPLSVLADCLRSMLVPAEGKMFFCADYSNIEGRGLVWLAGEEWKVQFFRDYDSGKITYDNYVAAYAKAFNVDPSTVTKDQRQIGKVMELALGYGGGSSAFGNMAKNYNADPYAISKAVKASMPRAWEQKKEEIAERRVEAAIKGKNTKVSEFEEEYGFEVFISCELLKELWRKAHPKVVEYWYDLESAAINAVKTPGVVTRVGDGKRQVCFKSSPTLLVCRLPSGRLLPYPFPQIGDMETPWGENKKGLTYKAVVGDAKQWLRTKTYGGSLSENVTQAVCRDILADAMLRLEHLGFEVVVHVHDEILAEAEMLSEEIACAYDDRDRQSYFEQIMSLPPLWAPDFPIVAKGWFGGRYRKE